MSPTRFSFSFLFVTTVTTYPWLPHRRCRRFPSPVRCFVTLCDECASIMRMKRAHAQRIHRAAIISGFNTQLSVTCRLSFEKLRREREEGNSEENRVPRAEGGCDSDVLPGGQFASRIGSRNPIAPPR